MAQTQLERIATLEAQHAELIRLLTETNHSLAEMKKDMDEVKGSLTKWKGIGAGIAITVSLIWSVAVGIWQMFASLKLGG